MGGIFSKIGNILLWKYERGSLAYDIIVILILLFIFLVPRSCFVKHSPSETTAQRKHSAVDRKPPVSGVQH